MSTSLPLRCPVSGDALRAATTDDLERINQLLESDTTRATALEEVEGVKLSLPMTKAWISTSGSHAYLDQEGLPILVPDAVIAL